MRSDWVRPSVWPSPAGGGGGVVVEGGRTEDGLGRPSGAPPPPPPPPPPPGSVGFFGALCGGWGACGGATGVMEGVGPGGGAGRLSLRLADWAGDGGTGPVGR